VWFRRGPKPDLGELPTRLREAAAWCDRVVGDDADAALWTPGLLETSLETDDDALWKALAADPRRVIDDVVRRRLLVLRECGVAAVGAPRGGRVLVCEYDVTLFEGATELESRGLVDGWDVPACDLWIGLSPAHAVARGGRDRVPPLLAWIPDALSARAESAIQTSSTEVFSWLDARSPSFARDLLRD